MKQMPITIRLVNLLNIYLTDTSIYLDKNISFYLYSLLINYVNSKDIEKLTFNMKIPGLISFYDYYQNTDNLKLGKMPTDLAEVLTNMSLASPAVCGLRIFDNTIFASQFAKEMINIFN